MALRGSVDCGEDAALYVRAPSWVALRIGCCDPLPRVMSLKGVMSRAGSSNIISSGGAELVLPGLEVLCPRMLEKRRISRRQAQGVGWRGAEQRHAPSPGWTPDCPDEAHRLGLNGRDVESDGPANIRAVYCTETRGTETRGA